MSKMCIEASWAVASVFFEPTISVVGKVVDISADGNPFVNYPGNLSGPVPARTILSINTAEEEKQLLDADVLLLLWRNGESVTPIIVGILRERFESRRLRSDAVGRVKRRVIVEASEEILFECGESSLRMRKDGRVTTKGRNLVSRSSGANKIKGASIQLN